jgi:hypothetical protein
VKTGATGAPACGGIDSPELQDGRLSLLREFTDVLLVTPEQRRNVLRSAVAETHPDDLRRRTSQDAEAMEILILGHQERIVLARELPHGEIRNAARIQLSNMQGPREDFPQQRAQFFRELFVKEQSHVSGGRNPERAPFTFGRVRQTRADVIRGELWKFPQKLVLRRAASQVAKNIADADSSTADAGLPEPYGRVDGDALQQRHDAV